MNILCLYVGLCLMVLSSMTSAQTVLFEGYSKILFQGQHVGFSIQRYQYDRVKRQYISTYFLNYNESFNNTQESLQAYANEGLEPLSYTYRLISGGEVKVIEAKAQKGSLKLLLSEKGKKLRSEIPLPKGSFLSTFLTHVILRSSKGLKVNAQYPFQAVAEESGSVFEGKATVLGNEDYKGFSVYKLHTDFPIVKGEPQDAFLNYLTDKGESLATEAPQKKMLIELVSNPKEALGNLKLPEAELRKVFGGIPEGRIHPMGETTKSLKSLEQQRPYSELGLKQGARTPKGIQTKSK